MNRNIQRYIGNDVLGRVLQFKDNSSLKDLPNTPQNLLKYAKRRVSPFISPYISDSLKIKMLESRMTDEEYLLSFYNAINMNFSKIKKEEKPVLSIVLSQTGAGKTELVKLILKKRKNSIIISTDLFKKYNPKLNLIYEEDPVYIGELTAIDSYDLANNIKEFALKNNYNLICEFAPSQKEIIEVDTKYLTSKGYSIEYHILAVGDLVSSLSIHFRYEKQIKEEKSENKKLTNLNRHDESYRELLNVIKDLPIDKTYIYRRGTEKERFVPQLLEKTQGCSVQKLYLNLINERENSNKLYALGKGTNRSFLQDFFKIKLLMNERNASEDHFIQLKKIFERYIRYINFNK